MNDFRTPTELDAAIDAQMQAYPVDQRDHDEPGINAADHDCALIPHPDDCWGCAAFVREAELREEQEAERVRQEVIRERNDEWWAS